MHAALDALQTIGSEFVKPYFLSLLADAYGLQHEYETALGFIQQAFNAMNDSHERWVESELYWRQGELLRLQGAEESACRSCFEQAVAIAQSQNARILELQAAMSLATFTESSDDPEPHPEEFCSETLLTWLKKTLATSSQEKESRLFQHARTLFRTLS